MRIGNSSMRVLAINCGSSTLKFQLFELKRDSKSYGHERRLAKGIVEEIGTQGVRELPRHA